jgi:ketosteroid isomerase-like protein
MKIIQSLVAFCLLIANAYGQTSNEKIKSEIITANKSFSDIFNQSGGVGVAALYADNAMILPPGSEMIGENEAIGKFWKGAFDAGVKKVGLETISVESIGSSAVETGKFILSDANDKQIDAGKYIVYWKKEKGNWKLYRDIWNSSQAPK